MRFNFTTPTGYLAVLLAAAAWVLCPSAFAANGFDLTDSLVPRSQIEAGGPPRDGIPAIDSPRFVPTSEVDFLGPEDRVLSLTAFGETRAYPVPILVWHEVVNDWIEDLPLVITYCPLCGSGMAFLAEGVTGPLTFGVSGLLYNSDLVLYDRETESLWSQLLGQAIAGPLRGTRLRSVPLTHTTWDAWQEAHPGSLVLSTDTGYARDYGADPYADYARGSGLLASVGARSQRYHPKERVLGVTLGGVHKAYPFVELARTGANLIPDRIAGTEILVRFDHAGQSARAFGVDGVQLPAVTAYWFAWYAFHPDTAVFEADPTDGGRP